MNYFQPTEGDEEPQDESDDRDDSPASPETDGFRSRIRSPLAKGQSVWSMGQEFWKVWGWGMNCFSAARRISSGDDDGETSSGPTPNASTPRTKGRLQDGEVSFHQRTQMAARWTWWYQWLNLVLEAIEMDWIHVKRRISKLDSSDSAKLHRLTSTLAFGWLGNSGKGPTERRRIIRAIFANGDARSVAEFGPIWPREIEDRDKSNGPDSVGGVDVDKSAGYDDAADFQAEIIDEDTGLDLKKRILILVCFALFSFGCHPLRRLGLC